MIPALHRAYVFLATEIAETLLRIGWYHTALDSVGVIFSEFSSNVVAMKATDFASGGFCIFFFMTIKVELMHSGFVVLPVRVDVPTLV